MKESGNADAEKSLDLQQLLHHIFLKMNVHLRTDSARKESIKAGCRRTASPPAMDAVLTFTRIAQDGQKKGQFSPFFLFITMFF